MRVIQALILLFFLLSFTTLSGQSAKPLGVILPPTIIGNITDSRRQILLNTLDDELSKHFDVSPSPQSASGELEVVRNIFQLQLVEEEGDTQLSLRWMSGDKRKVKTDLCGRCKTIELNKRLVGLVDELFEKRRTEIPVEIVEKSKKGVLFELIKNGVVSWNKDGNEKTDGKYVGEIRNGVPDGLGIFTTPDGTKYVGEFKNGVNNGQGTLISKNGVKYEGEWRNGKRFRGTFTWSNGDKYVGEWKNGKENGWGKIIYGKGEWEGDVYEGEWKDGKRTGQGTYNYSSGNKYVGEYKLGEKNGQGTFTWSNGSKYVGEWKDGVRNGQGTYSLSNGNRYIGEWKDDKMNGKGTFTFPDGEKYLGEWKDGKKNGQGTYTWLRGEEYVGEYVDGKRNGKGTFTLPNGEKFEGDWLDGELWNGTRTDKNANIIEMYVNGVKQL